MIIPLYRVEQSFPEDNVNIYTATYAFDIARVVQGSIKSGCAHVDGIVTEWAIFDSEGAADACEEMLHQAINKHATY